MSKFALRKREEINGKTSCYSLEVKGKCQLDDFWERIQKEGQYETELDTLQTLLILVSNSAHLPGSKYHPLDTDQPYRGWEIKTKNLRLYLIQLKPLGKVILLGGKKNNQKQHLRQYKSLKIELTEAINNKKIKGIPL